MSPLRVGLIGAGERARRAYMPVLGALPKRFSLIGVTATSEASAERHAASLATRAFADIESLAAEVDLLIVCTPTRASRESGERALASGCAVLLETPLAADVAGARVLARASARASAPIGVACVPSFLAMDCFRRQLIEAGAIGQVSVVLNDFCESGHNAFARLRAYLSPLATPVRVSSTAASLQLDPFLTPDATGLKAGQKHEHWDVANITFSDGSLLIHQATSAYPDTPFRSESARSLRVYGTRGTLIDQRLHCIDESGLCEQFAICLEPGTHRDAAPARIEGALPGGSAVEWRNPFPEIGFSDPELALALQLEAMQAAVSGRGAPLYSVENALVDAILVDAVRESQQAGGAPISLE